MIKQNLKNYSCHLLNVTGILFFLNISCSFVQYAYSIYICTFKFPIST